ncbi:hypothetical protein D3C81_2050080 [compost metagenome]
MAVSRSVQAARQSLAVRVTLVVREARRAALRWSLRACLKASVLRQLLHFTRFSSRVEVRLEPL